MAIIKHKQDASCTVPNDAHCVACLFTAKQHTLWNDQTKSKQKFNKVSAAQVKYCFEETPDFHF